MLVAGEPSLGLVLVTCLGGALSAGGAGAINHYIDRDLDAIMSRTSDRPVPSGRMPAWVALAFGVTLGVASFALLATAVNPLAASLSLGGLVGYVGVYTMWLKRRTPQNIVIGGAAGAVPPLVAWAAVTGAVGAEAIYLFAVVFFWTPPHFWALSLLMKDEYARAGVPMLPVVRGEAETRWHILLYTVVLVAWTILPLLVPALDLGVVYLSAALVLGTAFTVLAAADLPVLAGLSGAAVRGAGGRRAALGASGPGRALAESLEHGPGPLGDLLGGEPELLEQDLGGRRGAEGLHGHDVAVLTDPAVPSERAGGLHGHARPAGGRQDRFSLVAVALGEALGAGHAHHAGGDPLGLQ
jgi:protoheme IX farnesyltransferase